MTLFVLWPLRIVAFRLFGGLRAVSGQLLASEGVTEVEWQA
jgi:hypothetical protein